MRMAWIRRDVNVRLTTQYWVLLACLGLSACAYTAALTVVPPNLAPPSSPLGVGDLSTAEIDGALADFAGIADGFGFEPSPDLELARRNDVLLKSGRRTLALYSNAHRRVQTAGSTHLIFAGAYLQKNGSELVFYIRDVSDGYQTKFMGEVIDAVSTTLTNRFGRQRVELTERTELVLFAP